MELLRDTKIEEQFHKLVKNFLTRSEEYNTSKFIGGLPVTLERQDVMDLLLKDSMGNYKYTVTQKVDGTRMLMYIGYDSGNNQRIPCFIDRNMKIYTVRDSERSILPTISSREMLLDGELVFFDKDGNSHKELEYRYVKGVSFMTFDILFGPENIDINSDGTKLMGQSFSMMVPQDGILRTYAWKYINRYDILHKLIMPSQFNKGEPVLTTAFNKTNWFNIEIKPIYFLSSIKDRVIIYNSTKSGYLQTLLSKQRNEHYQMLMNKYNKKINIFIKKSLELDGLIFTAADTLYTIGTWNNLGMTQYKWKPVEQQTVDLLIKKLNDTSGQLFVSKQNKLEPFQMNYKNVIVNIPPDISNNSVAEFSIDSNGTFIFKEVRTDKKTPNALRTVLNVINSFKNPVNINELHYFLNIDRLNKKDLEKVLNYSSRSKLLQCALYNLNVLETKNEILIKEMITTAMANKDMELELRLGMIERNFNPRLQKDRFDYLMQNVEKINFIKKVDDFVDVYAEKIRTRYLFNNDIKRYVLFESIVKNRVKNVDLQTKSFLNNDIRVALSTETKIKEYNSSGEAYRKIRYSFLEPSMLFRIDFTIITDGIFNDRKFEPNVKSIMIYQVEVEILSEKVSPENIFKFLGKLF